MIEDMSKEFLEAMLNAMPVDFSFVDADDRLKYYNGGADRIFPRSPAAIGTRIQACHPKKSLEKVQHILDVFHNGTSDKEEFWFTMRDRKIYVQYIAVRDKDGKYLGCLECSQDITEIQKLEGEQRR